MAKRAKKRTIKLTNPLAQQAQELLHERSAKTARALLQMQEQVDARHEEAQRLFSVGVARLYLGATGKELPDGAQTHSDLKTHELRVTFPSEMPEEAIPTDD